MPRVVLTPIRASRTTTRTDAERRRSTSPAQRYAESRRIHSPARRAPTIRQVGGGSLRLPAKIPPPVTASRSEPNLTHSSPPRLRGYISPYVYVPSDLAEDGRGLMRLPSSVSISHVGQAIQTNLGQRVSKLSRRNKWLAPQREVQAEDVALCMLATHKLEFEKNVRRQKTDLQELSPDNPSRESLLSEWSADSWLLPPDKDMLRTSSNSLAENGRAFERPTSSSASSQTEGMTSADQRQRKRRPDRASSPEPSSEISFDDNSSTKSQFLTLLFQAPACDIIAGEGTAGDQARIANPFARNILLAVHASQSFDENFPSGTQSSSVSFASMNQLASGTGSALASPIARSMSAMSSEDEDTTMRSERNLEFTSTRDVASQRGANVGLESPKSRKPNSPKRRAKKGQADTNNLQSGEFYQAGMLDSMESPVSEAARKADIKAMKERRIHFNKVEQVLSELSGVRLKGVADLRKYLIRYCPPEAIQLTHALVGLEKALGLMGLQEAFFERILPDIVRRARQFFTFFPRGNVPTMRRKEGKMTMLRVQAAALLAMTFLCGMSMNELSMANLLCSQQTYQVAKLQFFVHYFDRLAALGDQGPVGQIEFRRAAQDISFAWAGCNAPLQALRTSTDFVANQSGAVQVIASHRNIGAGVFHRGRSEEEVLFCVSPELCIAMFVCQKVATAEAVLVTGVERFSQYTGDGAGAFDLRFSGDLRDPTPVDATGNLETCWLLIDPNKFEREDTVADQMEEVVLRRDLNKCFTGFEAAAGLPQSLSTVAANDWGCDALFRGALELKALVLWMAASAANFNLHLALAPEVAFAAQKILQKLRLLVDRCVQEGVSVAQLFEAIHEASTMQPRDGHLLPQILGILRLDRNLDPFADIKRTSSSESVQSHRTPS